MTSVSYTILGSYVFLQLQKIDGLQRNPPGAAGPFQASGNGPCGVPVQSTPSPIGVRFV
ncbi:hypothetical protein [Stappia sp.]|uniref:hypothetical protein n=1 Tax=Stappia sp. TaxID=1870903 RepID=UPI003C7D89F4